MYLCRDHRCYKILEIFHLLNFLENFDQFFKTLIISFIFKNKLIKLLKLLKIFINLVKTLIGFLTFFLNH